MNKTLIDELREWDRDYFGDLNTPGHRSFIEILSRHAEPKEDKSVEPLAVLAERKGETLSMVEIELNDDEPREIYFAGGTYPEAESKAINYLNSLPDKC